jgi:hypothetical protein
LCVLQFTSSKLPFLQDNFLLNTPNGHKICEAPLEPVSPGVSVVNLAQLNVTGMEYSFNFGSCLSFDFIKQNDIISWWHLTHTVFQLAAFRNNTVMHWKLFYLKPNLADWNWRSLWVIFGKYFKVLDLKISTCSEECILSFGWF